LWEADNQDEIMEKVIKAEKPVDKIDPFFMDQSSDDEKPMQAELRAVLRDGRVPKLTKNFEKLQQEKIERQRRREGWYDDPVPEPIKPFISTIEKPLKIKANKRDYNTSTPKVPVVAATVNLKF
jgi:hypothetical protein